MDKRIFVFLSCISCILSEIFSFAGIRVRSWLKVMPAKSPFCGFCAPSWRILSLLIFCCSFFAAQAELRWESTTVQLDLHPLEVTGKVEFPFKNAGTTTVDILAVRTTCGCLEAKASTNQVAAGESGTVDVTYNFRKKTGPQRKGVAIRVSGSRPVILYVQANVTEVYKLSAKRLGWSRSSLAAGDHNYASKTCRLVNQRKEPVRLISADSSLDTFDVELISIREGFEYEVRVAPKADAAPGKSVITVQTKCPPELKESRAYTFSAVLR